MTITRNNILVAILIVALPSAIFADEPETMLKPPKVHANEPTRNTFDADLARKSLDISAIHWQKSWNCVSCHTTAAYMMARPFLVGEDDKQQTIRSHLESMVQDRWPSKLPKPVYLVATACSLAIHDKLTSASLHPITRRALDIMWENQRADGGFDWLDCGWAPMEIDDHYGVTFAAVGVGSAPDDYAKTPQSQKGLDGIRRYLKQNPAPTLHHRAMILWASYLVDDILSTEEQATTKTDLLNAQRPDGGWSLSGLLTGWSKFKRKDDLQSPVDQSDAYGTGMIIYLALEGGIAPTDERIKRGVYWLKTHQRESGRWFTPSPTKDSQHYIANTGTAWAIRALHRANALP